MASRHDRLTVLVYDWDEYCFEWAYDDYYGWYCQWGQVTQYFVYVSVGVFTPSGSHDSAASVLAWRSLMGYQFAWDISWSNDVTISWSGSSPTYAITMDHDGFPLHEVRINGSLVYAFDPIAAGNTPNALAWPRDVSSGPLTGDLP